MIKLDYKNIKKLLTFFIILVFILDLFLVSESSADDEDDRPDLVILSESVTCPDTVYEGEESVIILRIASFLSW